MHATPYTSVLKSCSGTSMIFMFGIKLLTAMFVKEMFQHRLLIG